MTNSLSNAQVEQSAVLPKVVQFGRSICGDRTQSTQREWLITNGIGGYGCGTVSGILTRCYHGFLVAALKPPLGRTLLLTKLDETVLYQGISYPLSCDQWSGGTTTGHGYQHLESFRLEGTTPVWTYACADALIEKRIWMQPGENTTYSQYKLCRASQPLSITVKAIANHRDHHSVTSRSNQTWQTRSHPRGLKLEAFPGAAPFYLLSSKGQLRPNNKWYQHYFLTKEKDRGLTHLDDNIHIATLTTTLSPNQSFIVAASTQPDPNLNEQSASEIREQYEKDLLSQSKNIYSAPAPIQQLVLAADQFIVKRATPDNPKGKTIIAGYPWFGDWGRDTMIALLGLTLTTHRPEIAQPILRTFCRYLSQGMLPNAFPEANDTPGYNTVDAILWYFEAIRSYMEATKDIELLEELFPALQEVINWHIQGTRYNIKLDSKDGLIYAGQPGYQLTWMDAKVDDWVVTPRIGKPVEISALWHNALMCMVQFCDRLNQPKEQYAELADKTAAGFKRFWNADLGHCYDVLDGPNGNSSALRPNQLFAVSLAYAPPMPKQQQQAIVDTCAAQLLTSHGMRSLSPNHPNYIGKYQGDRTQRDGAYHQGTTWSWLIGPFIQAHLNVYKDPALARTFLTPLLQHMEAGCVGTLSEIFDGNAPFEPKGAFAQAWSVAEVLRLWHLTKED
ncbi:MAG: amylo-alpha-1,6-glucosidase [Phormidesmis sp.]